MYLVKVSTAFFTSALATGADWNRKVVSGLPAGCTLEVVRFKHELGIVEMYFTHPDKITKEIEECQITFERTNA